MGAVENGQFREGESYHDWLVRKEGMMNNISRELSMYGTALNVRVLNCATNEGVGTLAELVDIARNRPKQMLRWCNFGKVSLQEVLNVANHCGIGISTETNMTDQPIKGYRELSQQELEVINSIKDKANEVALLVASLRTGHVDADPRWVAIGQTDLQTGFMALVRSVAKPTGF